MEIPGNNAAGRGNSTSGPSLRGGWWVWTPLMGVAVLRCAETGSKERSQRSDRWARAQVRRPLGHAGHVRCILTRVGSHLGIYSSNSPGSLSELSAHFYILFIQNTSILKMPRGRHASSPHGACSIKRDEATTPWRNKGRSQKLC